jgi:hypothetical protein
MGHLHQKFAKITAPEKERQYTTMLRYGSELKIQKCLQGGTSRNKIWKGILLLGLSRLRESMR